MPTLSKLGIVAILSLSLNAFADAPASAPASAPVRTILEHHDLTGVPGKEALLGTAVLPAGTVIAFHTHPGDEFGWLRHRCGSSGGSAYAHPRSVLRRMRLAAGSVRLTGRRRTPRQYDSLLR